MTVIPEENKVLREHLAAFANEPGEAAAANVLLELFGGPARLYVYVDGNAPVGDGRPMMPLEMPPGKEGGASARMVLAHTQLAPEDAALDQEGSGLVCRPMPAWQLLQHCMHRGIAGISLNTGLGNMVAIGLIAPDKPLCVLHRKGNYPDLRALESRMARDGGEGRAATDGTIVPDRNKVLRERFSAFMEEPDDGAGAAILRELIAGQALLFVLVKGRVGGEGEPPITPADLSLMTLDDGRPIRMITATTELIPEIIAPSFEADGLFFRQLPAWRLMQYCLHRRIISITLDPGLGTEVMIGPIATDKRVRVVHKEKLGRT